MDENKRNIPDRIQILIIEYLSGTLDKGGLNILRAWLDKSKARQQEFNEIKTAWSLTENIRYNNENFTEKWERLQEEIHAPGLINKAQKKHNQIYYYLRIASVVVILVTLNITAIFYISTKTNKKFSAMSEVSAPLGSKSFVKLPDGSTVWLNAGSSIKYYNNINIKKIREVELSGEGYFDVKANPDKPFIVKTKDIDIVALGTSFNVKAYPKEKQIVTTLVKGKVDIKGVKNKKFEVSMNPNEKVTYYAQSDEFETVKLQETDKKIINNKRTLVVNSPEIPIIKDIDVATENYTSWKDDRWIIHSEKLEDLVVLLERRYNVSIILKSPELNQYLFSGTFQNETLEQVFQIIRLTIPISYKIDKGVVQVNLDKDLKKKYESAY